MKGADPILAELRTTLRGMYGNRLDRIVLFGSRARGDAQPDSDYDIAVFLDKLPDRWIEFDRLAQLRVDFLDRVGIFLDAKPYSSAAYGNDTPLMHEVRRDGLEL